jgi:hypothetical protein
MTVACWNEQGGVERPKIESAAADENRETGLFSGRR